MDELPVNGASGAEELRDDAQLNVSDEVARMLAEETRRIQADTSGRTQLLEDETILLGDQPPVDLPLDADIPEWNEPVEGEGAAAPADGVPAEALDLDDPEDLAEQDDAEAQLAEEPPAQTSAAGTLPGEVPGVIPLDETMLRPMAVQSGEEHYVVRNTRDYDHDAQSVNVVAAAENFETITEQQSRRSRRRDRRRDPYARSEHNGRVPGEGNSRSKLRPLLAMFIVALVLGGGAAVASYGMEMWGGKVVPSLMGASQESAEARLRDKGLVPHVEAVPADDAIGKVMSQEPAAGARVAEGGEVTIVVATNRVVPDIVGMYEDEAVATLREAGANNIVSKEVPSDQPDGMVIEVSPAPGEAFVSRGEVVVSVAGWYHVPDVIGKKENDALEILQAEGLQGEISYIVSTETVRTVVETEPAAGEPVSSTTPVQVRVSTPYPTDLHHLLEFFDHSSQDDDTFLEREGFTLEAGRLDSNGNAEARYTSSDKGTLTFSTQPYLSTFSVPQDKSVNALESGAPIAGIRYECPSDIVPKGRDRDDVEHLAELCGLSGLYEVKDNTNSKVHATAKYVCASGESNQIVWTVFITGEGEHNRAVVICGKKGIYSSSDLAKHNNSVSEFIIHQELNQTSSTQSSQGDNKQGQTDDKKDDKSDSATEGH